MKSGLTSTYQHKTNGIIRSKNEYRSGNFMSHWHPTMPHMRRTAATESVSNGEIDTILFTSLSFLLSIDKQTTPFL